MVKMAGPKVVFIEEVGNIVNFEKEVIEVLLGLQDCAYVVHAALVSMQRRWTNGAHINKFDAFGMFRRAPRPPGPCVWLRAL